VVGGGGIALRKVQGLVAEGAQVTVVALQAVEPLLELAENGRLTLKQRPYRAGEAASYVLVFAATDSREVNRQVFEDADGAGVWVNVADDPELCSFHLPARVQRGNLQIAVASGGEAPFAVRRLRQVLERRFGPEWGEWMKSTARFRQQVRDLGLGAAEQEALFDRFFSETVNPDSLSARVAPAEELQRWLAGAGDDAAPSPPRARGASADGCRRQVASDGLVSLVGAGPGHAGLLTVLGRRRLMAADAVVYDRLAAPALPCDLPARVDLRCVGKTAGHHPVPQEEISAMLVRLARQGKRVVRLKGGDPYVFGRGGEEAEALAAEGIPFEVIPGVTSGVASASWSGIPVTHRGEAVRLTLVTAHESAKDQGPQVRWDLLGQDPHATLVGYMGVTALPRVVEQLLASGMDPETPAALVERGTMAGQRSIATTVKELPQAVEDAGLAPPALFFIGKTVGHRDQLDWFSRLPLAGQRLALTAGSAEVADGLEAAGAEVVVVPLPVTPAARVVLGTSPLTGCVVASSADVDLLDEERGGPGWEGDVAAWCLGSEAADRARECGWRWVEEVVDGESCSHLVERIRRGAGAVE